MQDQEALGGQLGHAVEVQITPADSTDVPRLQQWLRDVQEVRIKPVTTPAEPGEQGDAWGFLIALCASGGAVPVLLGAVRSWIEARVTTVRVKIQDVEVELTGTDPEALEALLKAARKSLPPTGRS